MKTFSADYLTRVASLIFEACGSPTHEAKVVAEHLVMANLTGADSHGVMRIPQYVQDIQNGATVPGAPISITRETPTTAFVDVGWNFGQVGARRATEVAMDKARANGLGSVVIRHCRHVGCLGVYTRMAAEQDFVGMAMCGSAGEGHRVCPWGGREGRLATNPVSFAVPTGSDAIVMDFSTSMASEGKVRLKLNRREQLPEGWVVDAEGQPGTDPKDLYGPPQGAILPFGGSQGYKGFALALMAQIMSSLLGNPAWKEDGLPANANNMWLLAIDINTFIPPDQFRREVDELIAYMKSSELAAGFDRILMPGEPESLRMAKRKIDGIPVEEETWRQIQQAAIELGVDLAVPSQPEGVK